MESEKIEEIETLAEPVVKTKKPRSEKQIQAFELARQKRDANRKARLEEKARQEEEQKKQLEEKIVQKAIQIKKKQVMKQKVLEEISDDETPIEEVKAVVSKARTRAGGASPAFGKAPVARRKPEPEPDYDSEPEPVRYVPPKKTISFI